MYRLNFQKFLYFHSLPEGGLKVSRDYILSYNVRARKVRKVHFNPCLHMFYIIFAIS